MTFERWKEIKEYYRRPDYHWMDNSFGVTEAERNDYDKFRRQYTYRMNREYRNKVIAYIIVFIFLLFSMPVGCALTMNYYETQALENLTGKHLNYWDVFWSGEKIRANGELQDDPRRHRHSD